MFDQKEQIRHDALQRKARQRLDRIRELRAAGEAEALGMTQREIAAALGTNQTKVQRMLNAVALRGGSIPVEPEEIILEAFEQGTPRAELIAKLKDYPFTFGESAPYPMEGRIPGTWDQVRGAAISGYLSESELDEIRAHIGR